MVKFAAKSVRAAKKAASQAAVSVSIQSLCPMSATILIIRVVCALCSFSPAREPQSKSILKKTMHSFLEIIDYLNYERSISTFFSEHPSSYNR